MKVLALLLGALLSSGDRGPDLRKIGHIPSKPRIQDYRNGMVEELLRIPDDAVPLLVSRLTDRKRAPEGTLDFWPQPPTSAIALLILCDLFTRPDLVTPALPEMAWDSILERTNQDTPAWELYEGFIKRHGEKALQAKVRTILAKHRLRWNATERCFEPTG